MRRLKVRVCGVRCCYLMEFYLMLSTAFKFRKAFERLEEEDEHYRNYFKEDVDGSGNTRPPKPEDWDNAAVFVQFLEIFKNATVKFSVSLTVTSNLYFHRANITCLLLIVIILFLKF